MSQFQVNPDISRMLKNLKTSLAQARKATAPRTPTQRLPSRTQAPVLARSSPRPAEAKLESSARRGASRSTVSGINTAMSAGINPFRLGPAKTSGLSDPQISRTIQDPGNVNFLVRTQTGVLTLTPPEFLRSDFGFESVVGKTSKPSTSQLFKSANPNATFVPFANPIK